MNHSTNIQRIIDVLKSNVTIFEKNVPGKLRNIKFGNPPQNNASYSTMLPCAYVTTLQSLQKIHPQFGHSGNSDLPDKTDYAIIIASASDITESAQRQLYELEYNVKRVLEKDRTFRNPQSNDDALFSRSTIVDTYRDSEGFGKNIETLTIVLQTESGDANTVSIGDVSELTDIPILGITGSDGTNYSEDIPNGKRILTENNKNGSLFVEIELTSMIHQKLKEIFDADDYVSLVINQGSITDRITAYPASVEWVVQYDQINRRVLHFELK